MSNSVRPHRRQPTRLPRPWDSPGKNTGVGCHCLLQCMKVKSESEVAQSCLTLSDPMDCSPPGSSVHGIFQARVLEWGAILYYYHLTHHIFSPAPLTPKPFHLVVLCLPLPPYCLFPSQKPEWLLKMWVRSHHSSAQALQEVYILLRKKKHPHPFP